MMLFAQIVESGSISAAANHLDLSKAVLSQHLKTLEQQLGVTLLQRTTRRQQLTPAGERFYRHCQAIGQQAQLAWQQAQQSHDEPQGPVRITAPHALMTTIVTPAIGQLIQRYPKLRPQLQISDQQLDLHQQQLDLALRVGPSVDSELSQRRIGQFRDVLCASPKLANAEQGRYIANHWQGHTIHHQLRNLHGDTIEFSAEPHCVCDSFHSCLALIEQGVGIGLVPDFVLAQRSDRLQPLFAGYQLPANPIYLLHPYGKQLPSAVSHCIDAIEQQIYQSD